MMPWEPKSSPRLTAAVVQHEAPNRSLQPTCEDYFSEGSEGKLSTRPTTSPSRNVASKRHPQNSKDEILTDLSGDSDYTSHTAISRDTADARSISSSKFSKDSGYCSDPDMIPADTRSNSSLKRPTTVRQSPALVNHSPPLVNESQTSDGNGDIRLRVDGTAPISLQFSGDMEGRVLHINPAEGGMADIVIGSDHSRVGRRAEREYHIAQRRSSRSPVKVDTGYKRYDIFRPRNTTEYYGAGGHGSVFVEPAQSRRRRSSSIEHRRPTAYHRNNPFAKPVTYSNHKDPWRREEADWPGTDIYPHSQILPTVGSHRHGNRSPSPASSYNSSQTPSLVTTSTSTPESPPMRQRLDYPSTIIHNPQQGRTGIAQSSPASGKLSGSGNPFVPQDGFDPYRAGSSRVAAPEITSQRAFREQQRIFAAFRAKEQLLQKEKAEENAKQVRFELGRAEARERERARNRLANMDRDRADRREEARRKQKEGDGQNDRSKFEGNENRDQKKDALTTTTLPVRRHGRRPSMSHQDRAARDELLNREKEMMKKEREVADMLEQEERLVHEGQKQPGRYTPQTENESTRPRQRRSSVVLGQPYTHHKPSHDDNQIPSSPQSPSHAQSRTPQMIMNLRRLREANKRPPETVNRSEPSLPSIRNPHIPSVGQGGNDTLDESSSSEDYFFSDGNDSEHDMEDDRKDQTLKSPLLMPSNGKSRPTSAQIGNRWERKSNSALLDGDDDDDDYKQRERPSGSEKTAPRKDDGNKLERPRRTRRDSSKCECDASIEAGYGCRHSILPNRLAVNNLIRDQSIPRKHDELDVGSPDRQQELDLLALYGTEERTGPKKQEVQARDHESVHGSGNRGNGYEQALQVERDEEKKMKSSRHAESSVISNEEKGRNFAEQKQQRLIKEAWDHWRRLTSKEQAPSSEGTPSALVIVRSDDLEYTQQLKEASMEDHGLPNTSPAAAIEKQTSPPNAGDDFDDLGTRGVKGTTEIGLEFSSKNPGLQKIKQDSMVDEQAYATSKPNKEHFHDARGLVDLTKELAISQKFIEKRSLDSSSAIVPQIFNAAQASPNASLDSMTSDGTEETGSSTFITDTEDEGFEDDEVGVKSALDTAMNVVKGLLLRELMDHALPEATDAFEASSSSSSGSNAGSAVSTHASGVSSRTSSSQSQTPHKKKRTRGNGQDPGDEDDKDSDDDDRPKKKNERGSPGRQPHRRLKCPFYQRQPEKYTKLACRGEGFADMAKLKDHIKRVHTQPLRCSRCWLEMKNEDDYDEHVQKEDICEKKTQPPEDRIPLKMLKRLDFKKSPYANAKTVEEKWKMLFSVLFPSDTEIPSPYEQQGLSPRLERALSEALEEELTRELAPILDPILSRIKERIPAIIESCRLKLIRSAPSPDDEVVFSPLATISNADSSIGELGGSQEHAQSRGSPSASHSSDSSFQFIPKQKSLSSRAQGKQPQYFAPSIGNATLKSQQMLSPGSSTDFSTMQSDESRDMPNLDGRIFDANTLDSSNLDGNNLEGSNLEGFLNIGDECGNFALPVEFLNDGILDGKSGMLVDTSGVPYGSPDNVDGMPQESNLGQFDFSSSSWAFPEWNDGDATWTQPEGG